ncbi:MAG: hypothetical protein QXW35_05160 [Candidatus Aenigmatarchaeota archaeon]
MDVRKTLSNYNLLKKIFKKKRRIKGFLDGIDGQYVFGWAWDPENPEKRLEVVVYVDGEPVAEGVADLYREDLERAGIGDGRHGFRIELPFDIYNKLYKKENSKLIVKVYDEIIGMIKMDKNPKIKCILDLIMDGFVIGWAANFTNLNERLRVTLLVDENPVKETIANLFRKDLLEAKIGDGRYGFVIQIPKIFFDGKMYEISVKVDKYNVISNSKDFCSIDLSFINNKDIIDLNLVLPNMNTNTKKINVIDLYEYIEKQLNFFVESYRRANVKLRDLPLKVIDLKKDLNSFYNRLYLAPYLIHSNLDYIYLEGKGSGDFNLKIIAESLAFKDNIYSENFKINSEVFVTEKIIIKGLDSNCSLKLSIETNGNNFNIEKLIFKGGSLSNRVREGVRFVLLRTYNNIEIVFSNLLRLSKCCSIMGFDEILNRYVFIIYDTSERKEMFNLFHSLKNLKLIYFKGNNYGGGGNASFLIYLIKKYLEENQKWDDVDEIILIDDDAILLPSVFLTIDSAIAFNDNNTALTGIILSSRDPSKVQECGAFWGKFFTPSHQLTSNITTSRQFYPYLIRYGRNIEDEWTSIYLGKDQSIEYSTFIFLSIPTNILRKIEAPVPFFLRNDDLELSKKIDRVRGRLICNQNIYLYHEARHDVVGEFFSFLHTLIILSTYYKLDKMLLVTTLFDRISALLSTQNIALLEAYRSAIELFTSGPKWFISSDIFTIYKTKVNEIKSILKNYHEIPFEVIDVLKDRLEVYEILDLYSKRKDYGKERVFYDKYSDKYYQTSTELNKTIEKYLNEIPVLIGKLFANYDEITESWKNVILNFSLENFWSNYFNNVNEFFIVSENTVEV